MRKLLPVIAVAFLLSDCASDPSLRGPQKSFPVALRKGNPGPSVSVISANQELYQVAFANEIENSALREGFRVFDRTAKIPNRDHFDAQGGGADNTLLAKENGTDRLRSFPVIPIITSLVTSYASSKTKASEIGAESLTKLSSDFDYSANPADFIVYTYASPPPGEGRGRIRVIDRSSGEVIASGYIDKSKPHQMEEFIRIVQEAIRSNR